MKRRMMLLMTITMNICLTVRIGIPARYFIGKPAYSAIHISHNLFHNIYDNPTWGPSVQASNGNPTP